MKTFLAHENGSRFASDSQYQDPKIDMIYARTIAEVLIREGIVAMPPLNSTRTRT